MTWAIDEKSYSQRRACALVGLHPRTYRYASTRPDDTALRTKLRELASQRRRFGYRRLGLMLERQCTKDLDTTSQDHPLAPVTCLKVLRNVRCDE